MNKLTIDKNRGIDIMRGKKILMHLDGDDLDMARKLAAKKGGRYVRYWATK